MKRGCCNRLCKNASRKEILARFMSPHDAPPRNSSHGPHNRRGAAMLLVGKKTQGHIQLVQWMLRILRTMGSGGRVCKIKMLETTAVVSGNGNGIEDIAVLEHREDLAHGEQSSTELLRRSLVLVAQG